MNLNATHIRDLQTQIHTWNSKWWYTLEGVRLDRNKGELLSLIHSEVGEASLGVIMNERDDHLPNWLMEAVEMADTSIRILDYAEGFGYDLGGCLEEMVLMGIVVTFWDPTNKLVQHAQMQANIASVTEGERKNSMSDQVPGRKRAEVALAFTLLLIDQYCYLHGFDLQLLINEKCAYNLKRADHSHEARAKADGKKW